ncbi:MAG TPA: PIN domain-containing protein [Urbifossiella sp.]|nr:PIN domain-containing protein [Urbifossiella sp.]
MPPAVLLDTNVLVAGLRSSTGASHALLRAVGGPYFAPGLTTALVLEYESVLKRPGLVPLPPEDVDALLDFLCREGVCRPVRFRLRPASADPGDDLVLEAAVATGSRMVVTLNPRDLSDGAERYGLELLSPGAALARLGVPG